MRFHKILFLLLILGQIAGWAASPPTNTAVILTSHSVVMLEYQASDYRHARVRYGETTSYEGGAGGGIMAQAEDGWNSERSAWALGYDTAVIPGLKPNTLYYFCVQLSDDGASWTACGAGTTASTTTSATPAIHPVPPEAVTEVDTSMPDYSAWTQVDVTDCSNLQTAINNATTAQGSGTSTIIFLTSSLNCNPITTSYSGDWKVISSINTSTGVISSTGHGFSSNQKVRFAHSGDSSMPMVIGNDYWIVPVDANSFKVAATDGGSAITSWSDAGYGARLVIGWPASTSNKIILTSDRVKNGTFLPNGVRVSPDWYSAMPSITINAFDTAAINIDAGLRNFRLKGIRLTHTNIASVSDNIDPKGNWYLMNGTHRSNANIIFDQIALYSHGYPSRVQRTFTSLDGENIAIVNSYFTGWDWWNSYGTISAVKNSATVAKITAGNFVAGPMTYTSGTDALITLTGGSVTCTFDGEGNGCAIIYIGMDGRLKVVLKTGMTATCSISNCDVSTSGTPTFPVNGSGRLAAVPLVMADLTSGQFVGNFYRIDQEFSAPNERLTGLSPNGLGLTFSNRQNMLGTTGILVGSGPGPFTFRNNYLNGTGNPLHVDDGAAYSGGWRKYQTMSHFSLSRNTCTSEPTYFPGTAGADGLRRVHRQCFEFKAGDHVKVDGNYIMNGYCDVARGGNMAIFFVFNSKPSDVSITNNVFTHNCAGHIAIATAQMAHALPWPLRRTKVYNNLVYDNDAINYKAFFQAAGGGFSFGAKGEDQDISHNTFIDPIGTIASPIRIGDVPSEGIFIRANVIWSNAGNALVATREPAAWAYSPNLDPSCASAGVDKTLMDCYWTKGPGGAAGYELSGNLLMAGYNDPVVRSTVMDLSTACGYLGGTWASNTCTGGLGTANKLVPGTTMADRKTALGMLGFVSRNDFRLKASYHTPVPTYDGKDPGVLLPELNAALGIISNVQTSAISASGFTVNARVPDSGASCYVGYGTGSDPTGWSKTAANTTSSQQRAIAVTGTSAGTYKFRVWCDGTYETETFEVRTR